MIDLKVTPEYLAQNINYFDFLEICYHLKNNMGDMSTDDFLNGIKREFEIRPIRDVVMGKDLIENLIIHFNDYENGMICDLDNIYTQKQLKILKIAGVIDKQEIKFTDDGYNLLKEWSEVEDETVLFHFGKIKSYIMEWYCENV